MSSVTSFNHYFSRVSRKFSSRMTDQSNYESMSDSDAERRFKSVDEIDGRSVHVESRHQSRTVRSSKSTKYWLIFFIVLHLYFSLIMICHSWFYEIYFILTRQFLLSYPWYQTHLTWAPITPGQFCNPHYQHLIIFLLTLLSLQSSLCELAPTNSAVP